MAISQTIYRKCNDNSNYGPDWREPRPGQSGFAEERRQLPGRQHRDKADDQSDEGRTGIDRLFEAAQYEQAKHDASGKSRHRQYLIDDTSLAAKLQGNEGHTDAPQSPHQGHEAGYV